MSSSKGLFFSPLICVCFSVSGGTLENSIRSMTARRILFCSTTGASGSLSTDIASFSVVTFSEKSTDFGMEAFAVRIAA